MDKIEVYCDACNWSGRREELVSFPKSKRLLCPDCGKPDSICEADSVYFESEYSMEKWEKIE